MHDISDITKFDLRLFETQNSIIDEIERFYSDSDNFRIGNNYDVDLLNDLDYWKFTHLSPARYFDEYDEDITEKLKVENYLKSDEWKNNIKLIKNWLIKKYGSDFSGIQDSLENPRFCYNILKSEDYKKGVPALNKRVKRQYLIDDYDFIEKARIWMDYVYFHQSEIVNEKILRFIHVYSFGTEDGYEVQSSLHIQLYEALKIPYAPYGLHPHIVAKRIAFLELEEEYLSNFQEFFYPVDLIVDRFHRNFLSMPYSFEEMNDPYDQKLKTNEQVIISYITGFFIFSGYHYLTHPHELSYLKKISQKTFNDKLTNEVSKLVNIRLHFLDYYFDYILIKFMKEKGILDNSSKSKLNGIKFLKNYFEDIMENKKLDLVILEGIELPNSVNKLFCECILIIISKKIALYDGSILNQTLLPNEVQELNSKVFRETKFHGIDALVRNDTVNLMSFVLSKSFFDNSKINWRNEEKYIKLLRGIFSNLYKQKGFNKKPYMSKEDTIELIDRNFQYFPHDYSPQVFKFYGHSSTLRFFILSVYTFVEEQIGIGILQKRWLQFMLQNFNVFSERLHGMKTRKDFNDYIKGADYSKPKRYSEIKFNKKKLLDIIKKDHLS